MRDSSRTVIPRFEASVAFSARIVLQNPFERMREPGENGLPPDV